MVTGAADMAHSPWRCLEADIEHAPTQPARWSDRTGNRRCARPVDAGFCAAAGAHGRRPDVKTGRFVHVAVALPGSRQRLRRRRSIDKGLGGIVFTPVRRPQRLPHRRAQVFAIEPHRAVGQQQLHTARGRVDVFKPKMPLPVVPAGVLPLHDR